ncbi:MAG: hypothetical protein HYR56_09305 [Acidobacteria bacterium]|nr:hypothetical protein [Acidobacteriota bacterium]MBI3426359.1 hypothetical protein [Acidobacteriota bacterium]
MKNVMRAIGLTLVLATALLAAADGVTGKWTGSFVITLDGETKDEMALLNLKQNGTELTGTGGPSADEQWPIQNGKVEGDKLIFDVQSGGPLIKFNLTLADGHLKGEAKAEHDGHSMKAAVDLQRKTE